MSDVEIIWKISLESIFSTSLKKRRTVLKDEFKFNVQVRNLKHENYIVVLHLLFVCSIQCVVFDVARPD